MTDPGDEMVTIRVSVQTAAVYAARRDAWREDGDDDGLGAIRARSEVRQACADALERRHGPNTPPNPSQPG